MSWNPHAHGYLLLLLALTGALLLGMTDAPYPYVREGVVTAVMVFVLVKVFDRPTYRILSLVTGLLVLGSLWLLRVVPNMEARRLEILIHLGMVIFFALAVSMVLRHLFERRAVRIDDILGTLCGYLLAAMAFANLYSAISLIVPEAFFLQDVAHPDFARWYVRESTFLYFSLATITTIGYGDITPLAPTARSVATLEGVFGQFYIAVVVAQLVGSKLAEASARGGDGRH
jgi:Ion channel